MPSNGSAAVGVCRTLAHSRTSRVDGAAPPARLQELGVHKDSSKALWLPRDYGRTQQYDRCKSQLQPAAHSNAPMDLIAKMEVEQLAKWNTEWDAEIADALARKESVDWEIHREWKAEMDNVLESPIKNQPSNNTMVESEGHAAFRRAREGGFRSLSLACKPKRLLMDGEAFNLEKRLCIDPPKEIYPRAPLSMRASVTYGDMTGFTFCNGPFCGEDKQGCDRYCMPFRAYLAQVGPRVHANMDCSECDEIFFQANVEWVQRK